jgi:hypothetical protein
MNPVHSNDPFVLSLKRIAVPIAASILSATGGTQTR